MFCHFPSFPVFQICSMPSCSGHCRRDSLFPVQEVGEAGCWTKRQYMSHISDMMSYYKGGSWNAGTPNYHPFNRIMIIIHYKPSIWGYPHLWKSQYWGKLDNTTRPECCAQVLRYPGLTAPSQALERHVCRPGGVEGQKEGAWMWDKDGQGMNNRWKLQRLAGTFHFL